MNKIFVMLVVVGLSTAAFGQSRPDRKLGGCTESATICAGPSASASFLIINLSDGTSAGGFVPGAGYGVTFFADEWYNVGLSLYASYVDRSDSPGVFTPMAVISFAEYIRIGIGLEWTSAEGGMPSDTDAIMVFGLGLDFGSTPKSIGLLFD